MSLVQSVNIVHSVANSSNSKLASPCQQYLQALVAEKSNLRGKNRQREVGVCLLLHHSVDAAAIARRAFAAVFAHYCFMHFCFFRTVISGSFCDKNGTSTSCSGTVQTLAVRPGVNFNLDVSTDERRRDLTNVAEHCAEVWL